MRTVIFDLDGTLADTSGDLIAAANTCFRAMGHGDLLSAEADKVTAVRGVRAMLQLGLSRLGEVDEALVEHEVPKFLDAYRADIDRHTFLYPGAIAAVERLRSADYAVGICTNKSEELADILMSRLGVRGLFGSLVGADTLATRKPDPAPFVAAVTKAGGDVARSLLVGDTDTDRETARAAGVPSILVTFGPAGRSVDALEPEGLLHHYDALDDMVRPLIG